MPKIVVYRVQDVPARFSDEDLKEAILSQLEEGEHPDILLEHNIFPFCQAETAGNVALIKFNQCPRFLAPLGGDLSKFHVVRINKQLRLKFDRNFLGFTQLNRPDESQGVAADIVTITGIDGHAYGSWRNSDADFMWIEEGLPNDLPRCRVLLYGYDSKVESRNTNRLSDYCIGLREQLRKIRRTEEERTRPIFFIGHSFGGIIAANTLIQAATDKDRSLYNAIEAFLFFGTPHGGLIMDGIRKMLSDPSHPRNILIDQIDVKKEFLPDQLLTFKNVLEERAVVSFYETKQTRELQQGEDGRWARTGDYMHLSNRGGSILGLPDFQERKVPVDGDHSKMVKFESPTNPAYLSAVQYLKDFLQSAQGKVFARNDPMYNPRELIEWLSDVDFRAWEGRTFKPREVAPLGDGFFSSEGFKFWEEQKVSQLECYGAVGSGKTYLAYVVSTRLRESRRNACVVSVYIEPNNPMITVERLLGAMLKQALEARGSRAIPTNLQQYHKRESYNKKKPQKEELINFLEEGVKTYDYTYLVMDGFNEAPRDIQDDMFNLIDQMREHTNKIGVLYFKREDEVVPSTLPFCDNCGKVARVHYRCEQCDSPFFDLCPSCNQRDDGTLRCDSSHSLILDPAVVMILPARVQEMKRFVDFMIDNLIESAGFRSSTSSGSRRPANTSLLAKLCLNPSDRTPDLRKQIVENISLKMWGLNFRAAREWFDTLKIQHTEGEIMEKISQIPWRGSSAYVKDMEYLQTDGTHSESQAGWKIVSLVMAAKIPLKQEDLRTAEAALKLRKIEDKYMYKMDHSQMIFLSKGLITIIQDPNQNVVADPPFFDFFHSPKRVSGNYFREAHCNMASACLNYLHLHKLLESSNYDINDKFWKEPFLAYAACFWGEHVRLAESEAVDSRARDLLQDSQRVAALLKASWSCSLPQQAALRWDVDSGLHALHICAWFGLASLIPMVRGKSPIDELEPFYKQTPLMYASRRGHYNVVVGLLAAGANPTCFSTKGYNALFEALTNHERSQKDSKIRISKRLLEDGLVDIHATCPESKHRTALHIAAREPEEYVPLVDTLLYYGADPNRIDGRGWTPIMYATRLGRGRIVERLLEAPIDIDLFGSQWHFKTTALHLAVESGHQQIAVNLLARGANPQLKDVWGLNVEAKAKRKGLLKLIDLISEHHKQDFTSPNVDEVQPVPSKVNELHMAVSRSHVSRIDALLKEDPSLALSKDQCGRTPLHLAANNCNKHLLREKDPKEIIIAKILIPHSDLSATDHWGLTAMDYAIYNRRGFLQVELLDSGAEFDAHRSDDLDLLLSLAFHCGKENAMTRLFAKGANEFQAYPLLIPQKLRNSNIEDLRRYKYLAAAGEVEKKPMPMTSWEAVGSSDDSLKGQGVKRSFVKEEKDEAQKKGRFI